MLLLIKVSSAPLLLNLIQRMEIEGGHHTRLTRGCPVWPFWLPCERCRYIFLFLTFIGCYMNPAPPPQVSSSFKDMLQTGQLVTSASILTLAAAASGEQIFHFTLIFNWFQLHDVSRRCPQVFSWTEALIYSYPDAGDTSEFCNAT